MNICTYQLGCSKVEPSYYIEQHHQQPHESDIHEYSISDGTSTSSALGSGGTYHIQPDAADEIRGPAVDHAVYSIEAPCSGEGDDQNANDTYEYITEQAYRAGTSGGSTTMVTSDGLYRIDDSGQAYQIDAAELGEDDVVVNQSMDVVSSVAANPELVLQCVEYAGVGGEEERNDELADGQAETSSFSSHQTSSMELQGDSSGTGIVGPGSYELVQLPDGSQVLRQISASTLAGVEMSAQEAAAGNSGISTALQIAIEQQQQRPRPAAPSASRTSTAIAPSPSGSGLQSLAAGSYIIIPSSMVQAAGGKGGQLVMETSRADHASGSSSGGVVYQLSADGSPMLTRQY